MCLLFQNLFASGWLKEDHFLPMLIPSRAFWSLTFCHLWFICLAYDFWKMKEWKQWQPAFWKCQLKPWPQRTCQFGTWTVEMWNLSTERRECVRDGASWTILLQRPARPKPFSCLVIHHTNSRSHLIPCKSKACMACLLCARQHPRCSPRLSAQSKKDLESIFFSYLCHLPHHLYLLGTSKPRDMARYIFSKALCSWLTTSLLILLRGSGSVVFLPWLLNPCRRYIFLPKIKLSGNLHMLQILHIELTLLPDLALWIHLKGLPQCLSGKESTYQAGDIEFNPWFGKIPWRRKWQPTLVFLLGKLHGQRSLKATVYEMAKSWTQLSN